MGSKFINANKHQRNFVVGEPHEYWKYWKRPDPKAHKYWTYRNLKRKSSVKDSDSDDARPNGSDDNIPYYPTHWTYAFLDDIISDDNNSNAHHKRNSSLNQDKDYVDAYNKLSDRKSFHYHPIENVRSPIPNLLDRNQKQKDGFVGEPHEYGRFKRSASMQPDNEGSEIFTPTKKMQYKNENNVNSSSKKFPTEISNTQPLINGKPLGENFSRKTPIFGT